MPVSHIYLMVPRAAMAAMSQWYAKALAAVNYKIVFSGGDNIVALAPRGGFPDLFLRAHDGGTSVPTHLCFDTPST
jgi:hypothetical protein